jgi:hypothetical protein
MTARRVRLHQRRTYSATATRAGEQFVLRISRGAWIKRTDRDGAEQSTQRDPSAQLWANIGDRLVVTAAELEQDQIAIVEVAALASDGTPTVRVLSGEMPTGAVLVMPAWKAKSSSTKKRGAA